MRDRVLRSLTFGLLIILLSIGLIGCGSGEGEEQQEQANSQAQQKQKTANYQAQAPPATLIKVSEEAPGFTLVDQDGNKLSLSDLRGKVVVVDFIYTTCITACPLLSNNFAKIQDGLGDRLGKDVFLLSISFDTEHDTPQVLKKFGEGYNADFSGWKFLTGTSDEIARITQAYGVAYKKKTAKGRMFIHTILTVVIDQEGVIRWKYYGTNVDTDDLLKKVDKLLKEAK